MTNFFMLRCLIWFDNSSFLCTRVYAFNTCAQRDQLWQTLMGLGATIQGPWILCGDFHTILSADEKMTGGCDSSIDTRELQALFGSLGIFDLHYTGHFFTWCNQQSGFSSMYCKLDRVVVNSAWISVFPSSLNF